MSMRVVVPKGLGLLFIDSHPAGCVKTVADMCDEVGPPRAPQARRPVAVIVGSSSGYGLACTVAGLRRHGIDGVGVCFERPPSQRRTATAGWYRTAAVADVAAACGSDFSFFNADAFDDATKDKVLGYVAQRFGGIDYLIYSVAAPRRDDPRSGRSYRSVIKPVGAPYRTKTIQLGDDGAATVQEIRIEPATEDEVTETVKVMGGEDWSWWVEAANARELLRPGFSTVALSYIGSDLTSSIYRNGSIGAAKTDLEATAGRLTDQYRNSAARGLVSVNGAAVTQASSAIPGIGLYISVLHRVLNGLCSPARQAVDLWSQLTGESPQHVDDEGRIRLDSWELNDEVQRAVRHNWNAVDASNHAEFADIGWFYDAVYRLYGFRVDGIDYEQPCEVDIAWPSASGSS
jgi:enoyl-[acyl-carrier protein] reductase/trans-2-enoyl-CoA reductase (NAD+)